MAQEKRRWEVTRGCVSWPSVVEKCRQAGTINRSGARGQVRGNLSNGNHKILRNCEGSNSRAHHHQCRTGSKGDIDRNPGTGIKPDQNVGSGAVPGRDRSDEGSGDQEPDCVSGRIDHSQGLTGWGWTKQIAAGSLGQDQSGTEWAKLATAGDPHRPRGHEAAYLGFWVNKGVHLNGMSTGDRPYQKKLWGGESSEWVKYEERELSIK